MSDAPREIFHQPGFIQAFVSEIPYERRSIPFARYIRADIAEAEKEAAVRAERDENVSAINKLIASVQACQAIVDEHSHKPAAHGPALVLDAQMTALKDAVAAIRARSE